MVVARVVVTLRRMVMTFGSVVVPLVVMVRMVVAFVVVVMAFGSMVVAFVVVVMPLVVVVRMHMLGTGLRRSLVAVTRAAGESPHRGCENH